MKKIICTLFCIFTVPVFAYNNTNFRGSYGFRVSGMSSFIVANEAVTVGTGIIIADGKGKVTGHGTFRTGGIRCEGTIEGLYQVNADGTGFLATVFAPTTPGCYRAAFDSDMVLINNGNSFEISSMENDYLSGTLTKQAIR